MRLFSHRPRARMSSLVAVLLVASIAAPVSAQMHSPSASPDGISPHINAVLYNPEVQRHIRAWGLSVADVQHDVDAMPPKQRAQLAFQLTRPWRGTDSQSPEALQAQFLVMLSLMRESTLFASVISTRPARLLR